MNESSQGNEYPQAPDRRRHDRRGGDGFTKYLIEQSNLLSAIYMSYTREKREQFVHDRINALVNTRENTWRRAIHLLNGTINRDELLHYDEFSPILRYPAAAFTVPQYGDVQDFYVRPKIIPYKRKCAYEEFVNWLAEQKHDYDVDLEFIRAIPELAIAFIFYARTNIKYSPELVDARDIWIDQQGFIITRDPRLDIVVSNPTGIVGMDVVSSLDDEYAFKELIHFILREENTAHDQDIRVHQLSLQHDVYPAFDQIDTENWPISNLPMWYSPKLIRCKATTV